MKRKTKTMKRSSPDKVELPRVEDITWEASGKAGGKFTHVIMPDGQVVVL